MIVRNTSHNMIAIDHADGTQSIWEADTEHDLPAAAAIAAVTSPGVDGRLIIVEPTEA